MKPVADAAIATATVLAMEEPDFSHLADLHAMGDQPIPEIVHEVAAGRPIELVWRNDLGGLTFRIDDTFLKWNPQTTGIDLGRERTRLDWISPRHPAPSVIRFGVDGSGQWLLTAGLCGDSAVGDQWRARRSEAIAAIATGLRAIHSLPTEDFPTEWISRVWVGQRPSSLGSPPPIEQPVLVHGDACAPNTLISDEGNWIGHVDFGDLAVGDKWADLAIASLSLDWNFGEGHQDELFDAYTVAPDEERIDYYRALWHAAS